MYTTICRGKNTLFLFGKAKYSLNVTFSLQSSLLFSTLLTPMLGKKKDKKIPSELLWKTNDAHIKAGFHLVLKWLSAEAILI